MTVTDRFFELVKTYANMEIEYPSLKAVTIAQWMLETGKGKSLLFTKYMNAGGIKWRPEMEGFGKPVDYNAHDGLDDYVAFFSLEHFVRGYWRFIERAPYKGWRAHTVNPMDYIRFIKKCGYAEDDSYPEKVEKLLPEATALLVMASRDNDKPPALTTWPKDGLIPFAKQYPRRMRTKGPYEGGNASGVCLHHTAGKPGTGTLEYGIGQGYAFLLIDRDGSLHQAHDIREWGHHAGTSAWKGLSGAVSDDLIGIEVSSAGRLTVHNGKKWPWWAVEAGYPAGQHIPDEDCIYQPETDEDEVQGWYQRITPAQEAMIEKVCAWLLPRTSKHILVSHYEVARPVGRKNDIGGMSMSMTELRQMLRTKYGLKVLP